MPFAVSNAMGRRHRSLFALDERIMTKRDTKLLSRWPEHQKRGRVAFVLLHGIAPSFLGVLIGVLAYSALSPRHVVHWGGGAFLFVVGAVVGGVRATLLWDRISNLYAGSQQPQP